MSRLRGRLQATVLSPVIRVLLATLILATLAWEIASRGGLIDRRFVSTPSEIIATVPFLAREDLVISALLTTGYAVILAIIYGCAAGMVLGYSMGFFPLFRDAFYGPALFLLSLPKAIFLPLFMVFFGINVQMAIYYGVFSSFIYVLINVVSGLDLIEKQHLQVAAAYGATLRYRITDVIFPASLPGVFTGIWYGIKNSLTGVLIVELFAPVGGLGSLIRVYTDQLHTDRVIALVLGMSIVAIAVGYAWTALENRLTRWRPR